VQCWCYIVVVQMEQGQACYDFLALRLAAFAVALGLFGSVAVDGRAMSSLLDGRGTFDLVA
jgi:hypothetical protein